MVSTPWGPVTWFPRDHRITSQAPTAELERRLCRGFEAFNPVSDLGTYHGGRIPQQIRQAYAGQSLQGKTHFQ